MRAKVAGMPGPKPPTVVLSEAERRELERLVCAQKTGQALVRRARVVLLAALGCTNLEIARQVPMAEEAVGVWRRRWAAMPSVPLDELSVAERLADAPRPGHDLAPPPQPGAGVPDRGPGLRAAERFGPTDQPLEPPRAGR